MKIASIVGARPQFIKCAPLSKELRRHHEEIIIHTGQHYDYEMSKVFFDELNIPEPDYNLSIGSGSQGHQTGAMLAAIEDVLVKEEPQMIVVFGDTNSTIAGALAASKLGIPISHVEAGLRSYDRTMPEEINRVLTDHISNLLFAPTESAVANLEEEGIHRGVHQVGDIMVDSLNSVMEVARSRSTVLQMPGIEKHAYFVLTIHRAGNTNDPAKLGKVLNAIRRSGVPTIFPVHPRTKKLLNNINLKMPANLIPIEPLGYIDMIALISNARGVLTDSGGMQKESFILGTRCATLRENTEWQETFVEGRNRLVGLDEEKIVEALAEPPIVSVPESCPFGMMGVSVMITRAIEDYALDLAGGNGIFHPV
ncbi:non-hydrolyzing UDP-N-acetylglucosamine 2-epimerase [Methanomassiliicoccus luminyensis]|uniref:non-hydrolyzing UDP-N-acetylglucosamine 2-epimerase n=1 Tax=Methanomassiliicoccus luminyensis TaxID=1080712 RepID=UPI000674BEFD|nr:UDP-N-acetylglucosamine 2-epimerase (non-hydrolyzing) [Methanomassiliicoccus luminyensis]